MARVKRSVSGRKHRRAILEEAKGYTGARSRHFRKANEQVMHSLRYAYRDRRARKGEFRRLWIVRINAACREHDIAYSRFIAGLKAARGRRRPQDPRRPRGARAGDVRCARRDRARGPRRRLSPTSRSQRAPTIAPAARRCSATRAAREERRCVRGRRSAGRRGRARRRVPTIEAVYARRRSAPSPRDAARAGVRRRGRSRRVRPTASATRARRSRCSPWSREPHVGLDAFRDATLVVVGTTISDPGNAGTLMRSAAAAGATVLGLGAGSVDAYNPKVVRASAGACFAIRTVEGVAAVEMLESLGAPASAGSARPHRAATRPKSVDLRVPTALVLGHEAHGLDRDLPLDEVVTIPMACRRVAERRHGRHGAALRGGAATSGTRVSPAEGASPAVDLVARAEQIEQDGRAALAGAANARRARRGRTRLPRASRRRSTRSARRSRRSTAPTARRSARRCRALAAHSRSRSPNGATRSTAAAAIGVARSRSPRPHHRRARVPARPSPPGHPHLARARGRVRRSRLQGRRRPRGRARLVQLRGAELPARSPGPRHAGHALREARRARRGAAAHAHVAGAGPHHGSAAAADLRRSRPAACSGATRSTRGTRRSSTRSRASPSTRASRSATCSARSRRSSTRSSAPTSTRGSCPSFFPFTEPSVEFAMTCVFCEGDGLHGVLAHGLGRARRRGHGRPQRVRRRRHRSGGVTPGSRSASASTGSCSCSTASTT